ncbi:MAG: hypothetical protein BWY72_01708 [Bacteroidetes bacterium ADurb.Bin416]|nr:MAG: hypothetical protein BWY72_01708 [Bacteroidetes bacterium ADurb.Bin416]
MIHPQVGAKHPFESLGQLRGQGNFRHQHQRLLSLVDARFDEVYVQLCLARGGVPVQQAYSMVCELLLD